MSGAFYNTQIVYVGDAFYTGCGLFCQISHLTHQGIVDSYGVQMAGDLDTQLFGQFPFDIIDHVVAFHQVAVGVDFHVK